MSDITGFHRVERDARFGFPWSRLVAPSGTVVAELGRISALNIFLGRGQRVELTDGTRWRVKARGWQRFVCPMVVDGEDRPLAISAPGPGYAITCRDRGFELAPAEARPGRPRRWELIEFGDPVALVHRNPYHVDVLTEVPLFVVVLAIALSAVGVMGEKDLAPTFRGWGATTR